MASSKTIVLITGANKGLGLETAKLLLARPNTHVVLGCRDAGKATAATTALGALPPHASSSVSSVALDVTSGSSAAAAAAALDAQFGRLDVLVNNAGVYGGGEAGEGSPGLPAALQAALETNAVGAATVTEAMLPLLAKSSSSPSAAAAAAPAGRVVFVSTAMASLTWSADPTSRHHGPYGDAYRASKAALNMLAVQYAASPRLHALNVKVLAVDPGFLATDLSGMKEQVRQMGAIEPEVGAKVVVDVVLGERDADADAGRVLAAQGVNPW